MSMREQLEAKLAPWVEDQNKKLESLGDDEFSGYKEHTLQSQVPNILTSYPPQYIVGPCEVENGSILLV